MPHCGTWSFWLWARLGGLSLPEWVTPGLLNTVMGAAIGVFVWSAFANRLNLTNAQWGSLAIAAAWLGMMGMNSICSPLSLLSP